MLLSYNGPIRTFREKMYYTDGDFGARSYFKREKANSLGKPHDDSNALINSYERRTLPIEIVMPILANHFESMHGGATNIWGGPN